MEHPPGVDDVERPERCEERFVEDRAFGDAPAIVAGEEARFELKSAADTVGIVIEREHPVGAEPHGRQRKETASRADVEKPFAGERVEPGQLPDTEATAASIRVSSSPSRKRRQFFPKAKRSPAAISPACPPPVLSDIDHSPPGRLKSSLFLRLLEQTITRRSDRYDTLCRAQAEAVPSFLTARSAGRSPLRVRAAVACLCYHGGAMPTTENGAAREPDRRPPIAVLAFKDHVLTCTDIINVARCWARRGYDADILAYDTGLYPQAGVADEGVRLLLVRTLYGRLLPIVQRLRPGPGAPAGVPLPPRDASAPDAATGRPTLRRRLFRAAVLAVRGLQAPEYFLRHTLRLLFGSYGCVVACDTVSLLVARTVNLVRGTPFLYHSRELVLSWDLSSPGARAAKWLERRCHRRALFTVIQDSKRAELLGRDNGVPAESFLIVPNAPLGEWSGAASRYLHVASAFPGTRRSSCTLEG